MNQPNWVPEDIDISIPSAARTYDYLLGGAHNFAVDREAARQTLDLMPDARQQAQENRTFLHRAVRYLVEEAGVHQFLDIGAGIPTVGAVHEIAGRSDPRSRIVYVDIDAIAVAHSRAILTNADQATAIMADVRQPRAILQHPEVRAVLDFDQPIGLLLVAILHAIADADQPHVLVRTLLDALVPGSHMVLSHITGDGPFNQWDKIHRIAGQARYPITLRSHADIARFFDGLELIPPGLVRRPQWRPEHPPTDEETHKSNGYAGVGRLPYRDNAERARAARHP